MTANLDQVYTAIGEVKKNTDKLIKWSGAVDERCKHHKEETVDLKETLYGNPNGIVKRVNALWNGKKNAREWKDFWRSILKLLIVALIIAVAGWLLFLYKQSGN